MAMIHLNTYAKIKSWLDDPESAPVYIYVEGNDPVNIDKVHRDENTGQVQVRTVYGFWAIVEHPARVITADC